MIERFTRRDTYGHPYTDSKIYDRFMWSKDGKVWERDLTHSAFDGKAIDKLCLLEDIEDEFNCDLIVLFRTLKQGSIWMKKYLCGGKNEIVCINIRGMNINQYTSEINIVDENGSPHLLGGYGKIWALTREELEVE